jgi:hypothetical protein
MSKAEHQYAGCRIMIDTILVEGFWVGTWIVEGLLLLAKQSWKKISTTQNSRHCATHATLLMRRIGA